MNNLKKLREKAGLSLGKLSQELEEKKGLKVGRASLSNYERGEQSPREGIWDVLADYFGVSVPYIMGLSNEMNEASSKNSEEVAQFIINNTEIEEIADMMKNLVTDGNVEVASKITALLGRFSLILSNMYDLNYELDVIDEVITKIDDLVRGAIFMDYKKYTQLVADYHKVHNIKGKTVKETREIEKQYPKPQIPFKDLDTAIQDFQKDLSVINESLTKLFSKNANKLYNK
ncbi:MAG TPA: helix-turn-helix domain-containing protein [Enterococcus casseliflavus]|nr:helix-turn-helix domain-containing protein [Enterococcus casseliflavus]